MGVSSGSSSGSNFFSSNPVNLQNQQYQNLAGPVSQGLSNAMAGNPFGIFGGAGSSMFLSPTNYGPGGPAYSSSNAGPGQNPFLAPITGQQQSLLNTTGWLGGSANPSYNQSVGGLQQYFDPNYAANLATSPQTQAAVQGAVNPILQSFNAQTVPGLAGTFSAAGQRTNSGAGVGGSSAFDIAGANALTGLGANIGATAQSIVNPAYQTGLAQMFQAPGQLASVNTSELNNTINALSASALPQLTQQYGINQGLSLYNTQVNQLMTALGLGGQVSQPAIGNVAKGSGQSSGSSKGFSL